MDLLNCTVLHNTFGSGKICELSENTVAIRFGTDIRKFVFPDAFKSYLTMVDHEGKRYLNEILKKIDEENNKKLKAYINEEEKRKKLENYRVYANSQAVFDVSEEEKHSVLDNWTVSTGCYAAGSNRGKPRSCEWIYPNTACLLTSCGPQNSEKDRYIWGVFMVAEDFAGSLCHDGIVPAHKKFRIKLDDAESRSFLYWPLIKSSEKASLPRWGSAKIKRFSNTVMAEIISRFLLLKRGAEDEKLCEEFINYFCKLNRIIKAELPAVY